jgi:hypothetical protein
MRDDHKAGLERLGVLIGRTRSKVGGERVFLVLNQQDEPQVPQSMVETQPLTVIHFPLMLNG